MKPTSRPRSTRDRPAKPPLSAQAVVDAALRILKSDGLDAVTMRRVAADLDTGAASLYVYVSGRDGLLQALQDRISASVGLESADPARWRDQLHSLLERMRRALSAHPGIAAAGMADPPTGEATLRLLENLLSILLTGGIEPQDAAWAADIFALLVTYAAVEGDLRRSDPSEMAVQFHQNFVALEPEHFPLITSFAAQLVAGSTDERFHYAIDVVIDGVLVQAARR